MSSFQFFLHKNLKGAVRGWMGRLACLIAFGIAALAPAQTTIHVPADQPTIQAGINAANNGDTVLVAPGTYNENINFNGKAITVTSSGGPSVTTINGGNKPGVATVVFANGETSTSVISNFTITGGGDTIYSGTSDGGVYVGEASPTIQNNTVTANYCHNIDVQFGAAKILNNEVSGVLQSTNGVGVDESYCTFGSAIHLGGDSYTGRIPGNIVMGNTIENNLTGSAINLWAADNVVIMNNTIRKNLSPNSGSAFIEANSLGTAIVQNLIYDNTSSCGGAIAFMESGTENGNPDTFIANNTMADNVMSSQLFTASNCTDIAQIYPGGAYAYGESGPGALILNNVISGSTSYPAVNCDWFDPPSEADQPTFQNNILYNAGGPFFGSYCVDVSHEYNNIPSNPQFVNSSAGNYQLKSTSPAIDTGQNSALQTFQNMTGLNWTKDFAGNPRVQNGTGKGCVIDMGAYEYAGTDNDCGTSETLTSSLNPATAGQSVTFTAQLSAATGTPTGSVQFLDGTAPLSTQTVSGTGSATFSTSSLSIGNHAITANYQPTGSFSASTASLTQVINGIATTITFTSSLNPSNVGQTVFFNAIVNSSDGSTPTGTLQFLDGSTNVGIITIIDGGATLVDPVLTAGKHKMSAIFTPSGNYLASTASLIQIVNGLAATTTLTAAPNPAYALQSVMLTAKVTTTASGTPTGTVTFYDGGASLGTSSVGAGGVASLPVKFAVASTPHQLTAVYSGDATFNSSTSTPYSETILFNPTSTAITSIVPNPVFAYQSTTLTAKVSSTTGPINSATGTVTFRTGGITLGTATLTNGSATAQINTNLAGSYPVVASYNGDAAFSSSSSSVSTLTVKPEPSTVSLTSSKNPSVYGDSVTFTATVTAPGTGTSLTGVIKFFDGTTELGPRVNTSDGEATYTTSTLAIGTHPITAVYSGNAGVTGATSPVVDQVVKAYTGDFTLKITPGDASLYTGESGKFTVTATPQGGFNLPLALSCTGLPANATCAFAPATIKSGSYTSTLTVQTAAPSAKASAARSKAGWTGGATALACLCGLLMVPRRIRRRLQARSILIGAVLLGIFAAISGCGADGSLTGGTPPGTYEMNVIAQTTTVAPQLSHTATIKVVVKSLF
jgi:Bacterial Ig-like domain (group 3)